MIVTQTEYRWKRDFLLTTDPLENLLKSTLDEWYEAKHRFNSKEETLFLNSIKPDICPFCGSKLMTKKGKDKNGIQRYQCKSCFSRYTVLTGTIFDSHKIAISEWIEFLIHLFEYHSLKSSSRDNQNAKSTGKYWLFKIFEVLKNYQDRIVLSGKIYFDETYVPFIKKDKTKQSGKLQQICVGCATNGYNTILINEKICKESEVSTYKLFANRFVEGSTIIHDQNYSHNVLFRDNKFKSITYKAENLKGVPDKANPLRPINYIHFLFKNFMKSHGGYKREDLDDWLNLFSFMVNPPFNAFKKIKIFIEMALKTKKILRFRKVFAKKINKAKEK